MQKLPTSDSLELEIIITSKFLFWYRVTPHLTTGVPPSQLLFGRVPRSLLDLLKPDLSTKVQKSKKLRKQVTTDMPKNGHSRKVMLFL